MNTKAYDKLNYTMAIVGAAADGKRHGCIVNSFAQVTSSYPAKFVVSVNTEHDTCSAIEADAWSNRRELLYRTAIPSKLGRKACLYGKQCLRQF